MLSSYWVKKINIFVFHISDSLKVISSKKSNPDVLCFSGTGERTGGHPVSLPQHSSLRVRHGLLCSGSAWHQGGYQVNKKLKFSGF